ncbi:MAG: hypothetical protein Q9159_004795 [Coniocarpon cinnabarinum]
MAMKRKASTEMDEDVHDPESAKRREIKSPPEVNQENDATGSESSSVDASPTQASDPAQASRINAQQARFAALKARQNDSRKSNRKEAALESQRASINPAAINAIHRKKAVAEQKLARADAEANGEDYERKRAWDWTIDESERWDRRMAKKEKHREDVAFASYGQDARKVYKRQLRELGGPDIEGYEREKAEAVSKAANDGRLDLVEKENGEIVAVDRDGTWLGGREGVDLLGKGKVEKEKVDKLVSELKKAEEVRLRKMRQRKGDEDEDVTYINDKNKQFNQKLARFYNKYTTDIRDSFERGTAL